jgi:hypothetical protein
VAVFAGIVACHSELPSILDGVTRVGVGGYDQRRARKQMGVRSILSLTINDRMSDNGVAFGADVGADRCVLISLGVEAT